MSLLNSAAQIASAVAPAVAAYFGKSRSARRRRKNRTERLKRMASSGMQVPSAPLATAPASRRRGRRGYRRQMNQRSSLPRPPGLTKGPYNPPVASSGQDRLTYFKQTGQPKHKEWGLGVRYGGCSLWGVIQVPTTDNFILIPTNPQFQSDGAGGTTYFDLFAGVATGGLSSSFSFLAGRVFALHPALIARLQNECFNWGQYCFRNISFHSEAVDSTVDGNSFIVGLTHDMSWPLNQDQAGDISFTGIDASDIAQLENHASGPFYRSFALRSADYTGDRTWGTSLPIMDRLVGNFLPTSTTLWPYIQSSYQYAAAGTLAGGRQPGFDGFKGFVYVSYVIDFYQVKTDTSLYMQPLILSGGALEKHPGLVLKGRRLKDGVCRLKNKTSTVEEGKSQTSEEEDSVTPIIPTDDRAPSKEDEPPTDYRDLLRLLKMVRKLDIDERVKRSEDPISKLELKRKELA